MIGLRLALGAIALMAVATAGIGGVAIIDDHGRLGVAPPLRLIVADDSSFCRAVVAGAEAAAKARGIELEIQWPQTEPSNAAADLPTGDGACEMVGALYGRHALAPGAVLAADIMPSSPGNLHEPNSCGGRSVLHVSMANYSAGELCAATAAQPMRSGGTITVLLPTNPSKAASGRFDGFRDYFRKGSGENAASSVNGIDIVVRHIDPRSPARLGQLAREIQASGAEVVVDFTGSAVDPLLRAFDGVGPSARPRVITFDASDCALEAIEMGNLSAIITANPFQCGYQAVSRVSLLQQRGLMEHPANGRGSILLPPQVVRQGGVAEFRAGLRADRQM